MKEYNRGIKPGSTVTLIKPKAAGKVKNHPATEQKSK
jgi:hypothetical protein